VSHLAGNLRPTTAITVNSPLLTSNRGRQAAILVTRLRKAPVKSGGGRVRVLAVLPEQMQPALLRQLAPLNLTVVCAERALEIARLISQGAFFEVAILPAASSQAEWWALWGELCLIDPRPEILVYAQATSFQLWTGVLDMGGFDVIEQPFSDIEIQNAVLRAIDSFKERTGRNQSAE
jgi:DNA-binding NtrC family response regulator